MNYNGVYTVVDVAAGIGAGYLFAELQVPAGTQIEIIRMWFSPAYAITGDWVNTPDDVQEIEIYGNDTAATGGAGMTELEIQGQADAASAVTALTGAAQGSTPTRMYRDTHHLASPWQYKPDEDERIRVVGGSVIDNVGLSWPTAPFAATSVSFGVTWGELG